MIGLGADNEVIDVGKREVRIEEYWRTGGIIVGSRGSAR